MSRLITRTARLRTMIMLYVSLLINYALVYTMLITASPNSLNGVDSTNYNPALLTLQRFFDCLYFSAVCVSSIGYGDMAFTSDIGRIINFTQSITSVAFLSILFSNWIS